MTVRVYSKPACGQCTATLVAFERAGVEVVVDDLTDPLNLEAAKELGFTSAPVVIAGEDSWCGFRPDLIKSLAVKLHAG